VLVIAAEGYRSARDQGRLRVRNSEVATGARRVSSNTFGQREEREVVNARRPANVAQGGKDCNGSARIGSDDRPEGSRCVARSRTDRVPCPARVGSEQFSGDEITGSVRLHEINQMAVG
jgi:hypothetical protein